MRGGVRASNTLKDEGTRISRSVLVPSHMTEKVTPSGVSHRLRTDVVSSVSRRKVS